MTGSRRRCRASAPYDRNVRRTRSASCFWRRRLDFSGAGRRRPSGGAPLSRPSGPTTRRRIDTCPDGDLTLGLRRRNARENRHRPDGALCAVWSSPRALRSVHPAVATAWSIRARCASLAGASRNEPSIELRARVIRSARPKAERLGDRHEVVQQVAAEVGRVVRVDGGLEPGVRACASADEAADRGRLGAGGWRAGRR